MKKLFLVLFLFVSFSIISFGQNKFELQYISSNGSTIERGGTDVKKIRLKITNSTGVTAEEYIFKATTGLYFKNSVATSPVTFQLSSPNNVLSLAVQNTSATSIDIDIDLWVGQCFTFSTEELNTKIITTPFSLLLKSNNTPLTLLGNNPITISKGSFLNYIDGLSVPNVSLDPNDINRTAAFSYVLLNNSGITFNGNVSFQESGVSPAFDIRTINFYRLNGSSWELIKTVSNPISNSAIGYNNNSIFTDNPIDVPVNILNGGQIKVEEIVRLNGCLQTPENRNSYPILRWGNSSNDMCAQQALTGFMSNTSFLPKLEFTKLNGPNNYCYGSCNLRSYKITNTGNDVAKNVIFNIIAGGGEFFRNPYFIKYVENVNNDNDNVYMTINGVKYILKLDKYNIDLHTVYTTSNLPSFVPPSILPPWTTNGYQLYNESLRSRSTRMIPVNCVLSLNEFIYFDQQAANNQQSFAFSTKCIGGFDTKIIKDLYIDECKRANSTDPFTTIEIKPTDEVILYWNEVSCCFKNEATVPYYASSQALAQYEGLCGIIQQGFAREDISIQQKLVPAPTNGTTLGDVDRCASTSDGLVERISATIQQEINGRIVFPDNYVPQNGRIVFRVYVQNGLDLDKSLTKPRDWTWTNLGYNNITDQMLYAQNDPSNCAGACADPSKCNPSQVIPNNDAQKYYVRLRPSAVGLGKLITPYSVELIKSDDQIQNTNVAITSLTNPLPDLIFADGTLYANQLYEVSFKISDLIAFYESNGGIVSGNKLDELTKLLEACNLDFDLRAYCSVNGKPSYKVVMYHDRCTGAPSNYQEVSAACNYSCDAGFTTMQPIASFGNSFIVNCPGCRIPGANIEISSLVRSGNSRGLVDYNGDRLPDDDHTTLPEAHPTLKNVAMGDEMIAKFTCYMSDGEDVNTGLGITKTQLESEAANRANDNLYLDNVIINGNFSGGAKISGSNKNIEITRIKITYNNNNNPKEIIYNAGDPALDNKLFFPDETNFIFRAKLKELNPATNAKSFGVGITDGISFELTYKVGDMGSTVILPEITYAPYYSPCDECHVLDNMDEANPASNTLFASGFTVDKLVSLGETTLWKCSGFSNKFKFIPYTQYTSYSASENNCTKLTNIGFNGIFNGGRNDFFVDEYRTFLQSDLKTEVLIPKGYIATKIEIVNTFKIADKEYNESFLIQDRSKIPVMANSSHLDQYPTYCPVSIHFNDIGQPQTFTASEFVGNNRIKTVTDVFPDGNGYALFRGDEFYSVRIMVTLAVDPSKSCGSLAEYVNTNPYYPSTYENRVNSPSSSAYKEFNQTAAYQLSVNPHAALHTTADYVVDRAEGVTVTFIKPIGNMKINNVETKRIPISSSSLIQIPIELTNDKVNTWYTPNLDFPYIQISGDALKRGLTLVGVYQGYKNIAAVTPNDYYNEYLATSDDDGIIVGIDYQAARMRNPMWTPIPQLTAGTRQYTLVFQNTCPENCSQNIGCGTDNSFNPLTSNCLLGEDNLQIAYGWNCGGYPTFEALNANTTCGKYDPINYTVNIKPVGLTVNTYLNGNEVTENQPLEIQPCDVANTYKVQLNSCKETGFSEFEIEFEGIPSGVTIAAPATAGPFVVSRDATNSKLFHLTCSSCSLANQIMDVDFVIRASCKISNENLQTIIRSKTFCTPTVVPSFISHNPIQIKVDPGTFDADQILLSTDNISVVNGNYLSINYSVVGAEGTATKFDNAILVSVFDGSTSVYTETIVIPEGTPNGAITKTLSLGITSCGTYRIVLTPQTTYVPSCGIDENHEIIPACKNVINGTAISKNAFIGTPIGASITTSDGYASFICGAGSKVTFVAYPQTAGVTYLWSGPDITGAVNTNTIEATTPGIYTVVISNACGSSTATATVVDKLQVTCPDPICPGEIPNIKVLNFNGVVGTYKAQWYDPNGSDGNSQADLAADILMDKGIVASGYYYAATVTPSCTLRTNARTPQSCPITVKRAPQAFHITSDRPSGDAPVLFLCDGQTTTLSVTNKSVNDAFPTDVVWRSGQTTTDDVVAPGTWTNPGNLLTAQELGKSAYFIVAIDQETTCRTASNEIAIETPHIDILRTCDDGNGIKLTAYSNFNVTPDQYEWQFNGAPLVQGTNTVNAAQAGVYTVIEHSTGCALTNKCWGIKENLNTSAPSNQEMLSLQVGGFEGITATQVPLGFDTEFLPLDRTGYTGASLPADYTIGKFMINQSGLQASDWSPNVPSSWVNTNTTYSGDGALLIDGESEPAPKLIWGATVPVTHGLNYLYRFNVRNINVLTQYPVEEIPELYVQITYMDNAGNGTRYKTNKQALFNNGQSPWIEFSSYTPAIPVTILDCLSPSEIQTVRLELFMDGGGAIGRDISIDDVSLIPIGICDDVITLDLPCNAALAEVDNNQLIICPGTKAEFNINNAPVGLTYQWQSVVDGTLTTVGADASFTTPELNLTDPLRPAFFNYQVTITDPVNHCQTRQAVKAIVSTLPKVTITDSWTGSNCEKKFVAVFDGLGTPSQFEWYVNGTLVNGEISDTYISNTFNKDDVVLSNVNNVWCSAGQPVVSNSIVLPAMGIQADAGSDKTICVGESVTIGTAEVADVTYTWSPLTDLDDASKAQPVFMQSGSASNASYELTLTDLSNGCISTDDVTVTINTLPTVVITDPASVCEPGTVDLTAAAVTQGSDAGLIYTYFTDAAATNVMSNPSAVASSGVYYIQGKNEASCNTTKPVTVDIDPAPVVTITNPALVVYPNTVDLTLPAITLGSTASLNYSYFTDANATTSLTEPTAVATSGTYYIKGTTNDGCSDVSPVEVTIQQPLANVSAAGSMNVTLSPNPFFIQTYLSVSGASTDFVKITIVDMNGKVIFEDAHISNNERTPIGMELSSAVYILKIVDGEKIKIMKFVKL